MTSTRDQSLHVPSVRIRCIRNADVSSLASSTDIHKLETSTKNSSFKRRFTSFPLEQPTNQECQMTTARFSSYDDKSYSVLLGQKRPSVILQMMEAFVRRLSSRKKKHNSEREREEDKTVIDPVYETLRIAAETRKRTLADYIQQRQQSLNKQASFNSQGSSEADTQPSPRPTRHTDLISSSSHSQAASSSSSSGKRSQ